MTPPEITALPAVPLPDDVIDRVASEVARHVADHIGTMYPAAAAAVSHASMSRSIQGVIRNLMAEAGREAEAGRIEQWLRDARNRRLNYRRVSGYRPQKTEPSTGG